MIRFPTWNPQLKQNALRLKLKATALLRADTRRRRAAQQPKPKSTSPSPELPTSGWMPLSNLRRALRSNHGNGRAGTKSSERSI